MNYLKLFYILILTFLLNIFCASGQDMTSYKITLESIQSFFDDIKSKDSFDLTKKNVWNYSVAADDSLKLKRIMSELENQDYKEIKISKISDTKSGKKIYYLHFYRIETHTPKTLFERMKQFAQLIKIYELGSFNMDDLTFGIMKTEPIRGIVKK